MIKKYLQLARAHTVPLEAVPTGVGAVLALGTVYDIRVLFFVALGALYHIAGYSANSYIDYKSGHDVSDPNKSHHPLVSGELSESKAKTFALVSVVLTLIYGLWLSGGDWLSIGILVVAFTMANSYNLFSKITVLKPVPISVAHALMFSFSYVAAGGEDINILLAGTLYVLAWVMYQIAVSGEVKDVDTDEANVMKWLGSKVGDDGKDRYMTSPPRVLILTITLKITPVISAMYILAELGGHIYIWWVMAIAQVSIYLGIEIVEDGLYVRSERLQSIATMELSMVAMFLMVISPLSSSWEAWGAVLLSFGWVVVFNKIQWGTIISPQV